MGFLCFSRSPTIVSARRLYQSPCNRDFKVDIDIKCCVNGYLAKDKKQPATLIIFAVQLDCVENGAFEQFRMEVDFYNKDGATNTCKPEVICTAPFSTQEHINELVRDVTEKTTHSVKWVAELNSTIANAYISAPALKLGVDSHDTNEKESKYKIHFFCKGSSNTRCDTLGRRNGVWWNVSTGSNRNAQDDRGIPTNYLFAVVIKRDSDSAPFEARVRLNYKASCAHRMQKLLQILSCRPVETLVTFDPSMKLEGKCEGIEREMLGRYIKEGELAKLTVI
jgi:hypothetical protein